MSLRDLMDAGKAVWEHRDQAKQLVTHVRRWWKGSRVLLIGAGGTGKTTLAKLLAGETDWLTSAPWEYTESYAVERFRVGKLDHLELVVAPGQKDRRPATWDEAKSALAAGKYRGVVLVSAYGHHSLGDAGLKLARPGVPKERAVQEHLAAARAEELRVLTQVGELIRLCPKMVWLLAVVTKQDVWYKEEAAVRAFYESGEYAAAVRAVSDHCGADRFRHDTVFASLLISNFMTARGEKLRPNVEGYDQRMQIESVRRLYHAIGQLLLWEAGK